MRVCGNAEQAPDRLDDVIPADLDAIRPFDAPYGP
jgi:hypothetical protein